MTYGRVPPPGMTAKQWRRLRSEMESAQPSLKTASGILAEKGGRAVNRQTLNHVRSPARPKG